MIRPCPIDPGSQVSQRPQARVDGHRRPATSGPTWTGCSPRLRFMPAPAAASCWRTLSTDPRRPVRPAQGVRHRPGGRSAATSASIRRTIRSCASRSAGCGAISTNTILPMDVTTRSGSAFPRGTTSPPSSSVPIAPSRSLWRPRRRVRVASLAAGGAWRWAVGGGLVVTALIGAIVGWSHFESARQPQATGPALVIVPFQGLGGGEDGQLLASGLTNGLIADLMRFDGLQVFADPSGRRRRHAIASCGGIGARLRAYRRRPARAGPPARDREARRTRSRAECCGASTTIRRLTRARAARRPRRHRGGDRQSAGPGIWRASISRHRRSWRVTCPQTMFAYDCVQRAFAFRRTFAPEDYPPVRACLEEAVRRDPDYAAAWAMLAFAHMDAARFELVEPVGPAGRAGCRTGGGAARGRAGARGRPQPAVAGGAALRARRAMTRPSACSGGRSRSIRTIPKAWRSSAGD